VSVVGELTTIKELETPIKVTNFLFFFDLVFIIGYAFISNKLLEGYVYSKLDTLYMINCLLWGTFLILPASGNSKRKNWQNIINTLVNMNAGKTYKEERREVSEDEIR